MSLQIHAWHFEWKKLQSSDAFIEKAIKSCLDKWQLIPFTYTYVRSTQAFLHRACMEYFPSLSIDFPVRPAVLILKNIGQEDALQLISIMY